jgi:hypothetical protein
MHTGIYREILVINNLNDNLSDVMIAVPLKGPVCL